MAWWKSLRKKVMTVIGYARETVAIYTYRRGKVTTTLCVTVLCQNRKCSFAIFLFVSASNFCGDSEEQVVSNKIFSLHERQQKFRSLMPGQYNTQFKTLLSVYATTGFLFLSWKNCYKFRLLHVTEGITFRTKKHDERNLITLITTRCYLWYFHT